MENKLDKLFRDKLEQHSIAPSAQAWEKVEAGFPKKNNVRTMTWRIAAAIAALAVVGWFAYDFGKDDSVEITKDNIIEQPTIQQPAPDLAAQHNSDEEEKQTNEVKQLETKRPDPIQQAVAQKAISKPEIIQSPTIKEEEEIIEDIQPDKSIASVEEVITEKVDQQEPTVKPAQTKPMVIVYTLAPVETQQEVEPAKTNRLKKVLEFAKDVKSGDATTYASVRNWKDNLLGTEELVRVEKQNNQ